MCTDVGPTTNLPVKISGGARNTFTAEFMAREVGSHTISVDYNGLPVTGTPFTCKVYDAKNVYVSPMPAGVLRKSLQFTGKPHLFFVLCCILPFRSLLLLALFIASG